MSSTLHETAEDYPGMIDRIHRLKLSNGDFGRLVEEYHEVNCAIHRVERRVESTSETVEETLKRRRVELKDEIARVLADEGGTGASDARA